jgi:hypothetical protein
MGAAGFDTLKEYLKLRAGNRADLEAAGDSSLNYYGIWINSSYRQLCTQEGILGLKKKLYFPQLFTSTTKTTTGGTAYVAFPSDGLYVTDVFDTDNGRKLTSISWDTYISYTDRTTTASRSDSTEYVRNGTSIYLHPTPLTTGDTLTIYYKYLVTDLSGTQTSLIGAEWDDVIVELGAYKMFTWIHEYDKAKFCKEAFLEMSTGLADVYFNEDMDRDAQWGPSSAYMPGH